MHTVYELSSNLNDFYFALKDCFSGTVKLIKNADYDKYKYSEYGIGFDTREKFIS